MYGYTSNRKSGKRGEGFFKKKLTKLQYKKKQTLLYKRDFDQFEFGTQLKGEKKAVANLTASSQLYLSNGVINNMPQLIEVHQYFNDSFMAIPFLDKNIDKQYIELIAKDFFYKEKHQKWQKFKKSILKRHKKTAINIHLLLFCECETLLSL